MFKEKLSLVPELPGSYQMKDINGNIIYVGKAKNLKKRLKSYFNGRVTGKTKVLVENIKDFEYIVTDSELESLILEITLIKKYNPKYNVLLKDDKSYPYIEFECNKYPTLKIVRNVKLKRNRNNLYGPFPNSSAAKNIVNMINRIYPLKKCEHGKKLCLYYHIGECLGYCENKIEEEKIQSIKEEIISFLNGNTSFIKNKLIDKMNKYSESLQFEKAGELKTLLDDIERINIDQKIIMENNYNFDLFNYYQKDNFLSIQTFFIRNGTLFGRDKRIINTLDDPNEALTEYIIKFYEKNLVPKLIILPSENKLLEDYLNTKVETREKGDVKKLLDLAENNAKILLENKETELTRNESKRLDARKELESLLGLNHIETIESFDNSHLFGTFYVGAMVCFKDFLPYKDGYRKYKINVDIKDDYHAMKEVIYRRYFKVLMEESNPPDLIVADGGIIQVNAINEVLHELGLKIPVIGLKKDNKHRTNSIIKDNGEELKIDNHSNLFLYLANIQEEVHRFAITYHRNIKNKGMLSSLLDDIDGIGDKRKKELLKEFDSLKKIKEASIEELSKFIPENIAKSLLEYLNTKDISD